MLVTEHDSALPGAAALLQHQSDGAPMDSPSSRIAVGFDFSPSGQAALEAAARLAERVQAPIRVITSIYGAVRLGMLEQLEKSNGTGADTDILWSGPEVLKEVRKTVQAAVSRLDIQRVLVELDVGNERPARMIVDSAKRFDAELTVVGAKSRRGVYPRDRVGATAQSVVRRSTTPVLIVSPKRLTFPPQTIVCAIDESETAEHVFEWAVRLARLMDARLIVLHVAPRPELNRLFSWSFPREYRQAIRLNAQAAMDGFLERFDLNGVDLSTWILYGAPDHQILNYLEDEQVDLLVIGTQGRGKIGQMVLGGTAERVIWSAPCSVLAVKLDSSSPKMAASETRHTA